MDVVAARLTVVISNNMGAAQAATAMATTPKLVTNNRLLDAEGAKKERRKPPVRCDLGRNEVYIKVHNYIRAVLLKLKNTLAVEVKWKLIDAMAN